MLQYLDTNPIQLNYVSFASPSRVEVYYDVNDKLLLQRPSATTTISVTEVGATKHPLLVRKDYPVGLSQLCKFQIKRNKRTTKLN